MMMFRSSIYIERNRPLRIPRNNGPGLPDRGWRKYKNYYPLDYHAPCIVQFSLVLCNRKLAIGMFRTYILHTNHPPVTQPFPLH